MADVDVESRTFDLLDTACDGCGLALGLSTEHIGTLTGPPGAETGEQVFHQECAPTWLLLLFYRHQKAVHGG